jgi:DNA-binding MarR family transcriptional regulator
MSGDGADKEQDDADRGGHPDQWDAEADQESERARCFEGTQHRHGPLSPSALARHAGLHPATITGLLDRLERGGWVARDRDPSDRRAVVVRARRDRNAELVRLYTGMNASMDRICAEYGDTELEPLADFLRRTVNAGRSATDELAGH